MKNILIIGGAGYIGSACTKLCCEAGLDVTVIDNLSTGDRNKVDVQADFEKIDILNYNELSSFLEGKQFDALIHLAAHKNANESMKAPKKYNENIDGMANILKAMV